MAPDAANAIAGQPIEDPNNKVRQFTVDSLKTTLVPLNGATTVSPTQHNVGNGSFMPKYSLPNGGSLLGRDILWETRVKYVTPKYFWFALWNSGNLWKQGAINWTESIAGGTPIDFHFLVDAGWGHTQVASVNHSMAASELLGAQSCPPLSFFAQSRGFIVSNSYT